MSEHVIWHTKPCSVSGHCLLIGPSTSSHEFSVQMPIETAKVIIRACNNHKTLLDACKEQHEAIDRLFAMLIRTTAHDTLTSFFPSKSGQPWEALCQGGAAIEQTNKEI